MIFTYPSSNDGKAYRMFPNLLALLAVLGISFTWQPLREHADQ